MCQVSAVASTGGPKRAPTFYTENDTRGATGLPLSAESVLGGDQKNPAKEAPPVTLGETEGHGWVSVEMSAAGKGGGGKGVRFSDTVQLYSYARTDPEWSVLRTAPIDQISWDDQDEGEVMHLNPSTDSVDEAVGPVFPTQPQSEQQPFGDGNMTGQSSSLAGQAQNASVEGEWRASTDGFQPPQRPCNSVPVVSTMGTWKRRHPHLSIDVPQRTLPHLGVYRIPGRYSYDGSPPNTPLMPFTTNPFTDNSTNPLNNMYATLSRPVMLGSLNLQYTHPLTHAHTIGGTVLVKNIAFHKSVFVRWTIDNWGTYTDTPASFQSHHPNARNGGVDYFAFQFVVQPTVADDHHGKKWSQDLFQNPQGLVVVMQMAICYRVAGTEYWDNNDGANYSMALSAIG
eukprot:comp17336_c0_seq1/m.16552 comp17336_c0_seq1/g.16552  ORF comp17336_c0_seq1/g.16552 comp17336_c0_seq1/m.16552 type:complete len:398 (-) comp17336_c0_seq1:876-2069(-)